MNKSIAIALAIAACLAIVAEAKKCDSRTMNYLDSQIQLCARNVPVQQTNDPRWRCARTVTSRLERYSCSLDKAPKLLQSCLEGAYVSSKDATPAVDCLSKAISAGICC